MKISIFVPFMTGFGGTESVIRNLFKATELDTNNDWKLVICGGYLNNNWIKEIKKKNIIIKKFSQMKIIRNIQYIFFLPVYLLHYIMSTNDDIVISTNPVMWTILYLYKTILRKKIKVVSWYHYSLTNKNIKNYLLKKADFYLCISSGIQKELSLKGIENSAVVYNPIIESKERVLRSTDSITRFIYIGRIMLNGQKNMLELLNAVTKLAGNWKLDIFGTGEDEKVYKFIKKNNLENNIFLHGFVSDPFSTIDSADVLVLTSSYEGLPMVLNEGASKGIFLISSNCKTGPDDIINKNNGKLYDLGNEEMLRKIMQDTINGKIIIPNGEIIHNSISRFYLNHYYNNLIGVLKGIIN